ncbi:PREDICTED: uncharacterized protein LOC109210452 [Nicotiana attenuata]|uniref:uncharacterized protein LOC109210452 n=1 Tax=Nicotiana attenuata TaxID=49451 RepID=UPI000904E672|nr:PREDICTED: uncharacterized protein LOC109210452 [Nicotiana attenuata]
MPEYRNERLQQKKTSTPLGESYTSLFQRLSQLDVLRPIESKLRNPPPKNLDYSLRCAYYSDTLGHNTEKCWHLKNSIQELIDTNRIVVQSPETPNINPFPAHAETHMIEIVYKDGEPEKPSKSVMMIRSSDTEGLKDKLSPPNVKSPVLVVKGFPDDVEAKQGKPKVVVPWAASKPIIIVEGARTDPIVIKPVTQLPINNTKAVPWNYKQVIVTYKGKEVEEEVNETRGLTRTGRCFTLEKLRKAKPLKDNPILVKKPVTEEEAEEFLRKMKVQDYSIVEQLRKIPAQISLLSLIFETNRITFSDDELPLEGTKHNRALYLTVKCEDSVVTRVQVDNGSSAKICPLSTLHKLNIDTERIHKNNICVRGFDGVGKDSVGDIVLELTIGTVEFTMEFQVLDVAVSYNLLLGRPWIHIAKAIPSSLHQMAEDGKGPWVYQVFKTVPVEKIPERECIPGPKLASASIMVASEMLKNGFRKRGCDIVKLPVSAIPKPAVDSAEEVIERFQSLFDEVNMVEVGEGSSKADVQFIGPKELAAFTHLHKLVSYIEASFKMPVTEELIKQKNSEISNRIISRHTDA